MRYFGGKAKISKPLSAFLNSQLKDEMSFYDLFAGSCNVISKIDGNRSRYANDMHKELIALWQYVLDGGELPTEIAAAQYQEIKQSETAPDWLKGFVGFGCSFAGKWWGGYANTGARNYCANARNSTLKKASTMVGVTFTHGSYKDVVPEPSSMLYCDIPYRNTTGYSTGSFNHDEFYSWAVGMSHLGHTVLVSEYLHNLPDGWKVVWQHESKKDIRDRDGVQQPTVEIVMTPAS